MQIDILNVYTTAKGLGEVFSQVVGAAFVQCMVKEIDRNCAKNAKVWAHARKQVIGVKQRCMAAIPEGMVVSVIGPVWNHPEEQSVLVPINDRGEVLFNQDGCPSWQAVA